MIKKIVLFQLVVIIITLSIFFIILNSELYPDAFIALNMVACLLSVTLAVAITWSALLQSSCFGIGLAFVIFAVGLIFGITATIIPIAKILSIFLIAVLSVVVVRDVIHHDKIFRDVLETKDKEDILISYVAQFLIIFVIMVVAINMKD